MRIVFLNPIAGMGGAERCLFEFMAAVLAREPAWKLHLICGADGSLLADAKRLGVQAEVIPMPSELSEAGESALGGKKFFGTAKRVLRAGICARRYALEVRKRLDEIAPDLIHSNGIKFHFLTRMMGGLKAPVVLHIHDFLSTRRLMSRALPWVASHASLAIANSEATAIDARKVLRKVPVRTVLNCVDLEQFRPDISRIADLDALAGMPPATPGVLRVGLVAAYARWKGQDLFLSAAAKVMAANPNAAVRFYIIGGPIYKTVGSQFSVDELRAIAHENGLSDHVGFVPFQSAPETVYRALDIVVHSSTQPEPFGRSIAEAMACARAVIAVRAGGVPELFDDGKEALGIKLGDAGSMADAIGVLLKDSSRRALLGQNARAAAEKRFSPERLGAQLVELFTAVCNKSIEPLATFGKD